MDKALSELQLRTGLLALRQSLCQDLQYIAGIILNTGILIEVPPRIQKLTGLRIDELEAMETNACSLAGDQAELSDKTVYQLLEEAREIEWLIKMHLAAMDDVTQAQPRVRPIDAEGSFASFLELHDVIVGEMRTLVLTLRGEAATLDDARWMGAFWTEVLVPHARAEERVLFPLARAQGQERLTRSTDLVESDHKAIDRAIARYVETLAAVELEQESLSALVAVAQETRGVTELHFAKEEQSVIRPLQSRISSEQFQPVVAEQDQAIGRWLRNHGWRRQPASR